jgi:ATP-dependent DNA helicase RecQ
LLYVLSGETPIFSTDQADPVQDILQHSFGYDHFRGFQREVIDHTLAGGDSLVLMPTGGGKSLCYQIPALLRPGVAIVISPLIALMRDQVSALQQNGVRAAYINSSLESYQVAAVISQARQGELDLLYVAPERLLMDHFLDLITTLPLALFAIDEAHCVSQWGHDFRPHYLGLSILAERFPQVPRLALTATADESTRKEIVARLHLQAAKMYVAGFDRPNIRYHVIPKDNPKQQLLKFINAEHSGDSGIVYCLSRKRVEETAAWLSAKGWPSLPYHAGLDRDTRQHHQDRFLREDGVIIVATIAFGMGIDKPDVRFVAHLDLPKNLESYYQETGRAGRDGLHSNAFLTFGMEDIALLNSFIEQSAAEERVKLVERRKLSAIIDFCEIASCRRQALMGYFGDQAAASCGNCDNCLTPVDTWDGLEAAQKALSCVYRTGQRFGAVYLVDVLLGVVNDRIIQFNHKQISTFGIGKEHSRRIWRSIFRQLVGAGYLAVDYEGHGGLRLTEKSRGVLRSEVAIRFRKDVAQASRRSPKKNSKSNKNSRKKAQFNHGDSQQLWDALRALRTKLANEQGIPAYMIFPDRTLEDLVETRPVTILALGDIHGIGVNKQKKYGQAILKVLADQTG